MQRRPTARSLPDSALLRRVGGARTRRGPQPHGSPRVRRGGAGFRRAIEINPNWTWGYIKLARTLAHAGHCDEALAQAEIGLQRVADGVAPLSRSWLAYTWALCGREDRAREQLAWLEDLAEKQHVGAVAFAAMVGGLGDIDGAMDYMEKAYEERDPGMVYAPTLPALNPELANNERMLAVIEKMGLTAVRAGDPDQAAAGS